MFCRKLCICVEHTEILFSVLIMELAAEILIPIINGHTPWHATFMLAFVRENNVIVYFPRFLVFVQDTRLSMLIYYHLFHQVLSVFLLTN